MITKATIIIALLSVYSCSSKVGQEKESMTPSEDSLFQAYKQSKKEPPYKTPYLNTILELETIHKYDQGIRLELERRVKIYGQKSNEVKELFTVMQKIDSSNCIKVTKILDEYGWLGINEVGFIGNSTLFLVIQHSEQSIQEKYLPMMREAVKNDKADASQLALLEDRILLGQGKKQIYGSQIAVDQVTGEYIISPIEDEINVNKRRDSVGLGPLEEYVKYWGIVYTLPKQ